MTSTCCAAKEDNGLYGHWCQRVHHNHLAAQSQLRSGRIDKGGQRKEREEAGGVQRQRQEVRLEETEVKTETSVRGPVEYGKRVHV